MSTATPAKTIFSSLIRFHHIGSRLTKDYIWLTFSITKVTTQCCPNGFGISCKLLNGGYLLCELCCVKKRSGGMFDHFTLRGTLTVESAFPLLLLTVNALTVTE